MMCCKRGSPPIGDRWADRRNGNHAGKRQPNKRPKIKGPRIDQGYTAAWSHAIGTRLAIRQASRSSWANVNDFRLLSINQKL